MRIEEDIKLDYADVLFRPKRSTLSSRKDVELKRTYKFKYSKHQWSGTPIIAANMDGVGELEIAKLSKILFEEWNAKRGFVANQDFQKSLQFLDIYSKAIERTTPKAPQTIIVPKY